ncbi:OmpA family protein [Flaviaesturariibacter amylovorans]|uniref:OmpA-like domain-containing protein n=1 Tax=Flaviaesturariibacter amylovorans TaxID=1084520 RepID=A0ABP8GNW0_9BACT
MTHALSPARSGRLSLLALFLLLGAGLQKANAQFNVGDRIKEKVQQRAEEKVDKGIDDGLDAAEEAAKKKGKGNANKKSGTGATPAVHTTGGSTTVSSTTGATPAASLQSFSRYDFVPGEKVSFFEDFSKGAAGDFPVNWNTGGSGELVTVSNVPGRWLKWSAGVGYAPVLKEVFPDNFTLEFDILMTEVDEKEKPYFGLNIYSAGKDEWENTEGIGIAGVFLMTQGEWEVTKWSTAGGGEKAGGTHQVQNSQLYNKVAHVSVWGQKQRLRVYVNETKVLDLPQGLPAAKFNRIKFTNNPGLNYGNDDMAPVYLSNVRIATGQPDMRSKLITEGKLVTRGILFDVNSDKIRGESYGTLKEIAAVLKENPGIRVKVIGHTDSDGADAANLDLSKRRAAAVKAALGADFGVDVSGMITDGKGESEPAAPNTSPEGKANNRRVEFIKL